MEKDNFEIIEAYLLDTLSIEEKQSFEQSLQKDINLKREFDIMKSIFQSAEMSAKDKLKMDFEKIHTRNFPPENKGASKSIFTNSFYKKAAIVLVILGLLLAAWLLSNQNKVVPQDQLYAQYFDPIELDLSYRGDESNNSLKTLETLFNSKEYREFIIQIENLEPSENTNLQLILAKGQAHLELDQYFRAEKYFKSLLSSHLYEDQARWYLGLSYLKQEKMNEALIYLNEIDSNTKYGNLAKKLIKDLN